MNRYVKNIKKWFDESSEEGKVYDTTKPFPTHLDHCKDETWLKVFSNLNNLNYFINITEDEYLEQMGIKNVKIMIDEDNTSLIRLLKETNIK